MSMNEVRLLQRMINNILDVIEEYVDDKDISDEELIEIVGLLRYCKSRSDYKIDDMFKKNPHLL